MPSVGHRCSRARRGQPCCCNFSHHAGHRCPPSRRGLPCCLDGRTPLPQETPTPTGKPSTEEVSPKTLEAIARWRQAQEGGPDAR